MPVFVCNHCEMIVKNNGGSAKEIGMIEVCHQIRKMKPKYYCIECAKIILDELLEEI